MPGFSLVVVSGGYSLVTVCGLPTVVVSLVSCGAVVSDGARCINGAGIRVAPIDLTVGSRQPVRNTEAIANRTPKRICFLILSPKKVETLLQREPDHSVLKIHYLIQ